MNYGVTELLPGTIRDGQLMDRPAVIQAINTLFDSVGVANRQVSVALGSSEVIIKNIQTDRMKLEELRKTISWEAEQHVPFPLSEISLDFQILDPEGSDPQMNVLLVAAKRDLIDEKISLFEEAGCEVVLLDVDAFALMNALEATQESFGEGCQCIVHFGNEGTHLGLAKHGLPILTRNLPVGGRQLIETLQAQLGLSEDDAYLALIGQNPEGSLPMDLQPYPARLAGRYRDRGQPRLGLPRKYGNRGAYRKSVPLRRLLQYSRPAGYLPGKTGLPAEVINPLEKIHFKPELFNVEPVERMAPLLMLAIGLGLRVPD